MSWDSDSLLQQLALGEDSYVEFKEDRVRRQPCPRAS